METYLNDERIRKSLETTCPEVARKKAQDEILSIANEKVARVVPKICELHKIYEFNRLLAGRQASDDVKAKNVVCMKRILACYDIDPCQHDVRYYAKKVDGLPIAEHYAQKTGRVSDVRMARSIFSKAWVRTYKERFGIDVSWFANWVALQLDTVKVSPFKPCRREEELITSRCGALKATDPDLYKAYALAYGLGLRSSEIQRAKFSDLWEDYDGNKVITIRDSKSGGDQDRPCDPAWWDEVMSFKSSPDDLIVPVSKDRIIREFPTFLREECGITDKRPVHRLRKYAGHRIFKTNGNNIAVASAALGHSSIEITSKIYVGMPSIKASFIP